MISNHAFDLKPRRRATLLPCVSRSLAGGGSDRRGVHGSNDEMRETPGRRQREKSRKKHGCDMGDLTSCDSKRLIVQKMDGRHSLRPLTRSKEDFRKFLSLQLQKATLSLARSKKEDFDAILAYLAYLAEDFRSQRSDALRANKNLLYGDFEGLFTSQNF